jgi:predicted TPR repeat methyltransferase
LAQPAADLGPHNRPNYETPRPDVTALVPEDAKRILDLGCSTGAVGAALKQRQDATVVGVELSEEFAAIARTRLDRVVVADVEAFAAGDPPDEAPFDCLVAADVLEHLVDPWATMRGAVRFLRPGGRVVVSVPNVFYWKTLIKATARRRWPRDDEGIFDRTHLRWFGPEDIADLLREAGLEVLTISPSYWAMERWMGVVKTLAHTPLRDYLPAQTLVGGELVGAPVSPAPPLPGPARSAPRSSTS